MRWVEHLALGFWFRSWFHGWGDGAYTGLHAPRGVCWRVSLCPSPPSLPLPQINQSLKNTRKTSLGKMGSYWFNVKRLWNGRRRTWRQAGRGLSLNMAGDLPRWLRWALSTKLDLWIFHFPADISDKCAI